MTYCPMVFSPPKKLSDRGLSFMVSKPLIEGQDRYRFYASFVTLQQTTEIELCGGDYTGVVPPVPISNTEVKYTKADDSVMNAKVGSHHQRA